ncbi:MAG: RadC family protein [Clostridia bacterium]|nr:RadC family protein [Clostridia bacterium]
MSLHEGHRARLIEKLASAENSVLEHELLELLLFSAIPRRNTNDIAHRLLAEFGSIPQVFAASMEDLQRVEGIGKNAAAFLRCIGIFQERYYTTNLKIYSGEFSVDQFLAYAKKYYYRETEEVFDVYFLRSDREVFGLQRFSVHSPRMVEFLSGEFAETLVRVKPAGVVVVHNHPLGSSRPSQADFATTKRCQEICGAHNVLLCDHVIYGRDGVYSFYIGGGLKDSDGRRQQTLEG